MIAAKIHTLLLYSTSVSYLTAFECLRKDLTCNCCDDYSFGLRSGNFLYALELCDRYYSEDTNPAHTPAPHSVINQLYTYLVLLFHPCTLSRTCIRLYCTYIPSRPTDSHCYNDDYNWQDRHCILHCFLVVSGCPIHTHTFKASFLGVSLMFKL